MKQIAVYPMLPEFYFRCASLRICMPPGVSVLTNERGFLWTHRTPPVAREYNSYTYLGRLPHYQREEESYDDLVDLLIELALERENDSHMEKFLKRHPGGGGHPTAECREGKEPENRTHANKGGGKGQGILRAMSEAKPETDTLPLFYCKPVNDKGGPCHAPDCDHGSGCVLQLKTHKHIKDGRIVTHQDHLRCTITCGYCGKSCHYEDECHIIKVTLTQHKRQEAERQKA